MPRGFNQYDQAQLQGRLWTPYLLNPALWLDGSDLSTITIATGVSEWRDKSGNGRHVSQSTASRQPTLNSAGFLQFSSASSQRLESTATIATGNNYSIVTVIKDDNTVATISEPFSIGLGLPSPSSIEFVLDYNGGVTSNVFCGYSNAVLGNIANTRTKSAPTINSIGLSNGVGVARSNGVNGSNVGSGANTTTQVFGVGYSRPQNAYHLNGRIYEIVVSLFAIGSPQFICLEGYLAWKWGLTALLQASHPYANRPPLIGD